MVKPETTTLGTPLSPRWTQSWTAKVQLVEKQIGRRICGAHSPAWTPCKLSSTHPNGRCRFHGGAEGIGAPNGNQNALIHGLYARRLQRCGMQCPVWQSCPMSGKDVLALHPKERPNCVYEELEYNALTFFLGKKKVSKEKPIASSAAGAADDAHRSREGEFPGEARAVEKNTGSGASPSQVSIHSASSQPASPGDSGLSPSPGGKGQGRGKTAPLPSLRQGGGDEECENSGSDAVASDPDNGFSLPTFSFPKEKVGAVPLLHHNIAMYQVMLTRAGAALSVARLVDDAAGGEGHAMRSSRVGALLQAQIRISRELRQWIRLLANDAVRFALGLGAAKPEPEEPEKILSLPEMMVPILKKAEGVLEYAMEPSPPRPPAPA